MKKIRNGQDKRKPTYKKLLMSKYITLITIGFCLFSCKNSVEKSGYLEIGNQSNLVLKVESFTNNRGYGIINEKYWLPSNSKIKEDSAQIKNLILKNYFKKDYIKPIPRMSDLKLPYVIKKTRNKKQIIVFKENDTILFELTN